jgi:hypothetical protein
MLQTLSKVAAEPAIRDVMHPDHRALSSASIAHPAGDARYVAQACQSHPDTLMDRPSTVDNQPSVPSGTAGRRPSGASEKLANDHRPAGLLPVGSAVCGAGPWVITNGFIRRPPPCKAGSRGAGQRW